MFSFTSSFNVVIPLDQLIIFYVPLKFNILREEMSIVPTSWYLAAPKNTGFLFNNGINISH